MEDLDGLDFCGWAETSGIDITNCTLEKYGGFLGIPTNDMVTIMAQQLQKQRFKYESYYNSPNKQIKTPNEIIFEQNSMDNMFLYTKYLFEVFTYMQDFAHKAFIQ